MHEWMNASISLHGGLFYVFIQAASIWSDKLKATIKLANTLFSFRNFL